MNNTDQRTFNTTCFLYRTTEISQTQNINKMIRFYIRNETKQLQVHECNKMAWFWKWIIYI